MRLFDRDELLGVTKYFHYDPVTEDSTIVTKQDYQPILDHSKRVLNEQSSLSRWGDGKLVAHVPITLYYEWMKEGKHLDSNFLRKWVNDPANKNFRTFHGKV